MRPFALIARNAASGTVRSAGSTMARNARNGRRAAAATCATAWLSISTATAELVADNSAFGGLLGTISLSIGGINAACIS